MELKTNRETLSVSETVFDGSQEQAIELDYVLPDYYPDIFKLVKCIVTPCVVQSMFTADRISYDLSVSIKILYCPQEKGSLQCIEQKLDYTKTIELGRMCETPTIRLVPKLDYANCRVVNSHRIDLRGAVSIRCNVVCEEIQEAICDAYGCGIQLKKKPVPCAGSKNTATKRIELEEELDLGFAKPPAEQIIRCDGVVLFCDKKVIAGKVVAKGETQISLLYTCQKDGALCLEPMKFNLPFSQVVELDGADESNTTLLSATVANCEAAIKTNQDGEQKLVAVNLKLQLSIIGVRPSTAELVTDVYSTKYPCTYSSAKAKIEKLPRELSSSSMSSIMVKLPDGIQISEVYDAWSQIDGLSSQINPNGELTVMGNLQSTVMLQDIEGMPLLLESTEPFECRFNGENVSSKSRFDPLAQVISSSYSLQAPLGVEVKSEIRVNGTLWDMEVCPIITDIQVDTGEPKTKMDDSAIKLYFADKEEDVWEIAKKYSISAERIAEENDLDTDTTILDDRTMLLIPLD